jgi:hypothetical protein
MAAFLFDVVDTWNPWFTGIEVHADDETQARQRAEQMMFARRGVSAPAGVTIHPRETPDLGAVVDLDKETDRG